MGDPAILDIAKALRRTCGLPEKAEESVGANDESTTDVNGTVMPEEGERAHELGRLISENAALNQRIEKLIKLLEIERQTRRSLERSMEQHAEMAREGFVAVSTIKPALVSMLEALDAQAQLALANTAAESAAERFEIPKFLIKGRQPVDKRT